MPRKLILDGNTVYELDEECMLQTKSSEYDQETLDVPVNKEDEEKFKKVLFKHLEDIV